ncbi:Hexamerin [Frankliniella fusca]|uniref:Hexamerin n=1 Tax=Frankliniella fusca TaxID=407009 RepID=A0AAE1HT71_9NEOP|nr:Hexamerin [Frankliniella fusca]
MKLTLSLGLVALLVVACAAGRFSTHSWRQQEQPQQQGGRYPNQWWFYNSNSQSPAPASWSQRAGKQYPGQQQYPADKEFLSRQKIILQLLVHITQYNIYPEIAEIGQKYDIFNSAQRYSNIQAYQNFIARYNRGILPRGEIFNLYNDDYLEQAIALFDLFYFAKDFDTFISTAAWARDVYNEGQFAYAFYVAVIHREDTNGIVLPPLYEIYPYFYFYGNDLQKFSQAKQLGQSQYSLYTNFSGYNYGYYYGNYYGNQEQILSYFTEDIGLNAYNAYSHLYNPFWFSAEKYGFNFQGRGEYYYYFYQQILNFYNLNRIANYIPELEYFDWDKPIPYGYYPNIQYHSGKPFPPRPDQYPLQSIRSYTISDIQSIECRIREAIDSGYVYSKDGSRIPIFSYLKGISLLGNIIEGNGDSVNSRYYGSYQSMLRSLFALIVDPGYNHGVVPGVLANYETALRDPAFYYFYKYINRIFRQYAYSSQPAYKSDDLAFPGVSIKNIEIDPLNTYFDYFNVDVSNAFYVKNAEEANSLNYVARSLRLNHEPFSYKIYINSEKNASALVRVFFGPTYDAFYSSLYGFYAGGNENYYQGFPQNKDPSSYNYQFVNFDKLKEYFVEWDRFPVNLTPGQNVISRHSKQFTTTVGEYPSFEQIYKQVEEALQGQGSFYINDYDQQCGFPDRLVLPLGSKEGTPFALYAIISPYSQQEQQHGYESPIYSCSGLYNYNDNRPLGYPFDRQIIDFKQFFTPNMYFKDVSVYLKTQQQVNQQNRVVSY